MPSKDVKDDAPLPKIGWGGRLFLLAFSFLFFAFLLEVGTRLVMYVKEGFNPFYLTYGIVANTEWHSNSAKGYTKYQPNSTLHQRYHGATIAMKMNSDGFRGLANITKPKPAGVFRIVTLGESSTFGYNVQDNETYAYQLQTYLRAQHPDRTIEVCNLGIPHIRMENILAMAKAELPAIQPDVVTLYAGYNNALLATSYEKSSFLVRAKNWIHFHSVAWSTVHDAIRNRYYAMTKAVKRDVLGLPHLGVPIEIGPDQVASIRESRIKEYDADVERLADFLASKHIGLVLVRQTMSLRPLAQAFADSVRTYPQEVGRVLALAAANQGRMPALHCLLLVDNDLMNTLPPIAAARHLPLVDGIAVLDQGRGDNMSSYVHLTPIGNKRLAEAIGGAIDSTYLGAPAPAAAK